MHRSVCSFHLHFAIRETKFSPSISWNVWEVSIRHVKLLWDICMIMNNLPRSGIRIEFIPRRVVSCGSWCKYKRSMPWATGSKRPEITKSFLFQSFSCEILVSIGFPMAQKWTWTKRQCAMPRKTPDRTVMIMSITSQPSNVRTNTKLRSSLSTAIVLTQWCVSKSSIQHVVQWYWTWPRRIIPEGAGETVCSIFAAPITDQSYRCWCSGGESTSSDKSVPVSRRSISPVRSPTFRAVPCSWGQSSSAAIDPR